MEVEEEGGRRGTILRRGPAMLSCTNGLGGATERLSCDSWGLQLVRAVIFSRGML